MKDILRGRKEDMMYQNVFHIAPNKNFVIRVGGSQSHVMYFDENGLIHNADSNTTYFLGMLICGLATIVSAPAHFTEQEVERLLCFVKSWATRPKSERLATKPALLLATILLALLTQTSFPALARI